MPSFLFRNRRAPADIWNDDVDVRSERRLRYVFSHSPILETPRLLLRQMKSCDARDMYEYACQEQVTRYLLWEPHTSLDETRRYLEMIQPRYRHGDFYDWALIFRSNSKMIGTCGFASIDLENRTGEVGYVLNPAYWGQGIAAEALRAALRFGFDTLKLNRIEARYMMPNVRSRRVMEKCGMTYEGCGRSLMFVKGAYRDVGICAILRKEYQRLPL